MQGMDHGKSALQNSKLNKPQGYLHMSEEETGLEAADLVLRTTGLGFRKRHINMLIRTFKKRKAR